MVKVTFELELPLEKVLELIKGGATPVQVEARKSESGPAPASEAALKRRGRPPKVAQPVEPAAEPAAEAPVQSEPEPAPQVSEEPAAEQDTGETLSPEQVAAVRARFSKLVAQNYQAGLALLDEFGVSRFSEIEPVRLKAFAAKLDALEV